MTVVFDIVHTTHYRYARAVGLSEHRVLFRPRDSHDLRVLATDLEVTPPPVHIRLIQDPYSNSVALVQPLSPAEELKVVCSFTVQHSGSADPDFHLSPRARHYPFRYDDEERLVLAHYLRPWYDDPQGRLAAWARQFVQAAGPTGSRQLLLAMAGFIRSTLQYRERHQEGVQTPHQTHDLHCK